MKKKIIFCSIYAGLFAVFSVIGGYNLHQLLAGNKDAYSLSPLLIVKGLMSVSEIRQFSGFIWLLLMLMLLSMIADAITLQYKSGTRRITKNIKIPLSAGEGQYGTADFLNPKDYKQHWTVIERHNLASAELGGLVLGMTKYKKSFIFNEEDSHSFIIGATRAGKSRYLILPSIGLTAMAGESMVIVDVKGELFGYTSAFLESEGYECVTLDFETPECSSRYNFLQSCIDAVNRGDIPKATSSARDIANILVADGKNDPIWTDGARSVLMTAILAVVIDNVWKPEHQNLANVHQFITHMCTPVGKFDEIALTKYMESLPEDHPARFAEGTSNVAPSKMRGSFYTQGLVALDMFTDPHIHTMTAVTDFDMETTGVHKRAIFIILPDQIFTYHPLAALFISQHYQTLVGAAKREGGRLKRRVQFFCDEFGNFVKIPNFDTILTVSGGRGIRFHLALQDVNQLDEKYGEKIGRTIRSNCETWVYLQTDDKTTRQELSEKCGKYTIKTPSLSASSNGQSSASYSLTGRDLLMADEIGQINRPNQLVTSRALPAMMMMLDISKTVFQKKFGMGSKNHNKNLLKERQANRPKRAVDTHYWGIWNDFIREIQASQEKQK